MANGPHPVQVPRLVTRKFSQQEWSDIVSGFQDLSLVQTWEFGEAKAQTGPWQVERAVFEVEGQAVGAVQCLVRSVPWLGGGLVRINRGPLWRRPDARDQPLLVAMLAELRRHWVEQRRMYLHVIPPVRQGEVELTAFQGMGYHWTNGLGGVASAVVDLTKPEAQLRKELRRKWRGDLNSAERRGVSCVAGRSPDLFEEFLDYWADVLLRKRLSIAVTPRLLGRMQALLPEERKLWVFQARLGAERLGALLIAPSGDTCLALAGSSPSQKGRDVHAGNLIWWQAILKMKESGYRWLDVGGTDPERTSTSILHFKAGLNGTPYRLAGELESSGGGLVNRLIQARLHGTH